jgi:iron complex outermembrane receptor protein
MRVSAPGDKTTGAQYNETTNEDTVAKDYSVRARYLLQMSDDIAMNLIADYDKVTQNYSDPSFTYVSANAYLTPQLAACGITPSYANQERCPVNPQENVGKTYGFSAQFDIGLGAYDLTSISAYRRRDGGPSSMDIMGLPSVYQNVVIPGPENNTQIYQNDGTSSAHQFSQELRIASPEGQRLEYVAGLFYSDYQAVSGVVPGGSFNVDVYLITPPTFTPFILKAVHTGTFTDTTNKSAAAFGQMTYHATDKLNLIAGLRYTNQSITDHASANIYAPTGPGNLPADGSLDEDNVSGRLGLQYKFSNDLTSYVTAVRGYKGPQVSPASQGNPQTVIAAEIPMAYEVDWSARDRCQCVLYRCAGLPRTTMSDQRNRRTRVHSGKCSIGSDEGR